MSCQFEDNSVAHFIKKTYDILQNDNCQEIVHWLPSGKQFSIQNIQLFQQQILPLYFRHSNIHSFIRQLNMYGFHKSRKDLSKNIFSNKDFQKGREDLLPFVRRKTKTQEKSKENNSCEISQQKITKAIIEKEYINRQEFLKLTNKTKKKDEEQRRSQHNEEEKSNCSLKIMICPSQVMNENPELYSNLRHNDEEISQCSSDNISINGEIEKERKASLALRSGVSLVQTHNLLKTHHLLNEQ